jgi:hypothetical protein
VRESKRFRWIGVTLEVMDGTVSPFLLKSRKVIIGARVGGVDPELRGEAKRDYVQGAAGSWTLIAVGKSQEQSMGQ